MTFLTRDPHGCAVKLLATILLLAGISLAAVPSLADPARAPGSRLVLDLPHGFAASPTFSGFVHLPSKATIILLEVPASAYPDMARGLSAETLSSQGITDVQTGTLDRGGEHVYVTGEQSTPAGPFAKQILLFREGAVTALLSASVPKSAIENGSISAEAVERALASARLAPGAGEKPFSLSYTGPFRDTGAFIGQSHFYAIVDPPGIQRQPSSTPPSLIVAAALDGPQIDDLEATGRAGIAELTGGQEPTTLESQRFDVAGLEGVEHVAPPKGSGEASDAGIYQVILKGRDGGYYRIVGKAPAPEWPTLLPEFRKIAQSFAPQP